MKHVFWFNVQAGRFSVCCTKIVWLASIIAKGVRVDVDSNGEADFVVTEVSVDINAEMQASPTLTFTGGNIDEQELLELVHSAESHGWEIDDICNLPESESILVEDMERLIRDKNAVVT